jgi:hypothetical protein
MFVRRLACWWTLLAHVLWLAIPPVLVSSPTVASAAALCGSNNSPVALAPTLNEFMPDPASGTEWVELFNPHDQPIAIGGWKIDDSANNSSAPKLIPAGTIIGARGFYQHAISGFMLNNDSDAVRLLDASDAQIACKHYVGGTKGSSWGRMIDGSGLWHSTAATTPGAANIAPEQSTLLINEFMPLPQAAPPWIELHNVGHGLIDLEGLLIDDAEDDQRSVVIAEPLVLPAGSRTFAVFDLPSDLLSPSDGLRLLQPDRSILDDYHHNSPRNRPHNTPTADPTRQLWGFGLGVYSGNLSADSKNHGLWDRRGSSVHST